MADFVPSYYSGINGYLLLDPSNTDPDSTDVVAFVEFSISITREVAELSPAGSYASIKMPGQVSVEGSITKALTSTEYIGKLLGKGAGTSGDPYKIGYPSKFSLIGRLEKPSGSVYQQMNFKIKNCFFTEGSIEVTDPNDFVQTEYPFAIMDPETDLEIWEEEELVETPKPSKAYL